ncbi:MAG TPA: nitrilase-related carbon-nitrogen hydrolase [Chthoniobacterales bacterium]|jgi:apolipoprotein N-acyltransferase
MPGNKTLLAAAAGILSATLAYFGTGLHPIWWLLWLAPIPLLIASTRISAGFAFLLAFAVWLLGEMNVWHFFRHVLELPLPVVILGLVIPAVLFGLAVLLTRSFLRRGSLLPGALAFPVLWVTCEYLNAISSPHSTSGNLAYSQMDCLPLIQVASITGIWGISFIVFLFAGAVSALLTGTGERSQRRAVMIMTAAVICAVFAFGAWRLRENPPGQTVTATLVARDVPISVYLGPEEKAIQLLHDYADEVRRLTPAGTQVVVLPEKIGRISQEKLPELDALFSSAAAATNASIVVGLVQRSANVALNSARLYSPDGKLQANYDKHHLLLGVEPEKPGDKIVVVDQPSGRWGLQICKDMDFPQLSREYGKEGANLLLVPAWDFGLDRELHSRMAVLRAVENGFALARSARNGLLTLSDNRGRILAEKATLPDQFVSLTGKLPVTTDQTFYSRTGDWFAWACGVTLGILLVWSVVGVVRRRR